MPGVSSPTGSPITSRVLVAPDGSVADDTALLYDQAFALLAFCEAPRLLGPDRGLRQAAEALLDDMTVHDPEARLWPQTERLKAHSLMARLTGEPRHWRLAGEAAQALEGYFHTGARGLWHDRRLPDGSFVRETSPASSFYHIVCAVGELASALETAVA